MSREDPQLKVRLNEELKAAIVAAAAANHRSVNAEISARLERSFPPRDEDSPSTAGFVDLPAGVSPEDFGRALEEASRAAVAETIRRLGITYRNALEDPE